MKGNVVNSPAAAGPHVAMIFEGDADDPASISGMPFHMAAGLKSAGARVTPLTITPRWAGQATTRMAPLRRYLPDALSGRAVAAVRGGRNLLRRLRAEKTMQDMLTYAASQSAVVAEQLDELAATDPPDVVFSCSISRSLYKLETRIPIIFYNDTTAQVVMETYPLYMRAPRGYRQACIEMERDAIGRAKVLVFATEHARDSAINDYSYNPERIFLAPMGANVLPEKPDEVTAPAPAPTRDDLRLCVIAADPERKRVDMCVEITEQLVDRGVAARLAYIGPPTRRTQRSRYVECLGRLSLSNAADRQRHRQVLADSHIQLLPSLGEAFGIAPCESAHYARPSIVTDVGGLPTVVLHNETGFVLPLEAGVNAYVEHVERLVKDPALYRRLSIGALERARSTLNWEAWGRTVVRIMQDVVEADTLDAARPPAMAAAANLARRLPASS